MDVKDMGNVLMENRRYGNNTPQEIVARKKQATYILIQRRQIHETRISLRGRNCSPEGAAISAGTSEKGRKGTVLIISRRRQ